MSELQLSNVTPTRLPLDTTHELVDNAQDGAAVGDHGLNALGNEIENVVLLLAALTVGHVGTIAGHAAHDLHLLAVLDNDLAYLMKFHKYGEMGNRCAKETGAQRKPGEVPGDSSVPAKREPSMTVAAPQARALTMSPEVRMPPSAITGTSNGLQPFTASMIAAKKAE